MSTQKQNGIENVNANVKSRKTFQLDARHVHSFKSRQAAIRKHSFGELYGVGPKDPFGQLPIEHAKGYELTGGVRLAHAYMVAPVDGLPAMTVSADVARSERIAAVRDRLHLHGEGAEHGRGERHLGQIEAAVARAQFLKATHYMRQHHRERE